MSEKANLETKPETPATVAPAAEAVPVAPEVITAPPAPENILTRIVRAIDRAMSAEPKRTGPALTMAMILETAGGQHCFVSENALAKLREFQKLYDKDLEILLAPPSAKNNWLAHQSNLMDAIHGGTHGEIVGRSPEDFHRDYEAKIEAAKENLQKIYRDCYPLCAAIAENCIAVAEQQTAKRETYEREQHEFFGVNFPGPSAIVRTFREAISFARVRSQFVENGQASPRLILPYLNF